MDKPLILVTNDDGINAKGIHELVDMLLPYGDVVVICPDGPRSAQSMALTVATPIFVTRLDDYHGAVMYKVSGTPVDCVKMAMHTILDRRPSLIVSGINHGSNAAVNLLYSGTMGAAMEGAVFGIPSIGFSLTSHAADADFGECKPAVDLLVPATLKHGLPEGICLNVNVPHGCVPTEMRVASECRGHWSDEYVEYTDPAGRKFYWLAGSFVNTEPDNTNTDEWCLSHGIVSVVPISIDRSVTPAVPLNVQQDRIADVIKNLDWLKEVCAQY